MKKKYGYKLRSKRIIKLDNDEKRFSKCLIRNFDSRKDEKFFKSLVNFASMHTSRQ